MSWDDAAGQARQPGEEAVEPLEGVEPSPGTPESAEGHSGGQEVRDRALLARHLRVLASAVNVEDWPAYIRKVAAGHEAGTSWYEPVQEAPEEPEPPTALCNYGHTMADHERAGACERPGLAGRRPHWLPAEAWMGVIVGQWPLQAFTSQEQAERWADAAKWSAQRQQHEQRRIWRVEIPVDTQTFKVETVPASTKLVEVQW